MSVDARTSALKNVWWVERDKLGIARTSEVDSSADYISPSEIKELTIYFISFDEDFVATVGGDGSGGIRMDESPAIPEEFHEALAHYVIARGYELNPQGLQAAVYWKSLWKEQIAEAKKYANKGRDASGYHIRQYDY
tara:strand:- start:1273 stop:1683 length:411 start_codon:yes stop_codon:yes gene_type:complete